MSRRIEVELTSDRGDGTLTWRAAGAREPKGVLSATLLPSGVKVGDTVKVDADYDMEGVTIIAVLPPAEKKKAADVIEFIGAPPPPPRDYSKEPERRERKGGRRGERKGGGRDRHDRGERGDRPPRDRPPRFDRPEKPKLPPKPKAPRLRAGRKHRDELLASIPEEQRPVAEQVLKGGIPAVRDAIEEQNAAAKAAGNPPVKADALLALADTIVPKARVAEWRDRAEAAIEQIDTVDLRDLRSVVTKAEGAAKDEESRELAERLRAGLATRLEKEQAAWLAEIAELLADDRVVRALNVSSRPPKAGTPLPRDLAERLATAAGAALTDQVGAKRWATVLEALALSPVHAQVTPASVPSTPNEELLEAVKRFSMQVPQIAAVFGIEPKPAPRGRGPRSGRGKPRAGGAPAGADAKPKAPRIPPPPPRDETPVAAAPVTPPAEDAATEAPAEGAAAEAPAAEAPSEDAATEAPAEAVADVEAPAEEAAVEAPAEDAATEAPAEEAPADEAAATEAPAEVAAAAVEAPAEGDAAEAPAEVEAPADEPAAEAPAEEAAAEVEAPAAEAPADSATADAGDDQDAASS